MYGQFDLNMVCFLDVARPFCIQVGIYLADLYSRSKTDQSTTSQASPQESAPGTGLGSLGLDRFSSLLAFPPTATTQEEMGK